MSAWEEYVRTARRLDAVRRATAATVAEEVAAGAAARAELASVRARLAAGRDALHDAATRAGLPPPDPTPLSTDLDAANAALRPSPAGGAPAAALSGLRHARSTLDGADAELASVSDSGRLLGTVRTWPPPVRNLVIYGPLASLVLVLPGV